MNIELIKYDTSKDSKVLYILLSGVSQFPGVPEVKVKQLGSDEVSVPVDKITWSRDIAGENVFANKGIVYVSVDVSDVDLLDKNALFLVSIQYAGSMAEYPVYRKEEILTFKMDMMNILASKNMSSDISKYYTRLLFFESGLRDAVKYSDIIEASRFYNGLKDTASSFKTKYYYNEKG